MTDNYDIIINKISKVSGVEKEELDRRVEAKRAKLAGLISREGAAQVIAAELGINFDNEKLKINELLQGMRKVNVHGKVINLFPVRSYTNNKGVESKVANFILADETSNIKVVLWDTNHIELIEKGEVSEGCCVEIENGSMRSEEIHLGSFSEFKLSSEMITGVVREKVVKEKPLCQFCIGDSVKTRAFIVQTFEMKFFNVCPECRKKVIPESDGFSCKEHGKVIPENRALISLVLDDGTETTRATVFYDSLKELGFNDISNREEIANQRQELLGKEMFFTGNVRKNQMFNNADFVIESCQEVNPDELIQELEGKS